MSDWRPMPIASRSRRRWVASAALSVLLLAAAGAFTYSRLTADVGHHRGDTITHAMPGGGSVSFTLEYTTLSGGDSSVPAGMRAYGVRIVAVDHTPDLLNITSAQFAAGPVVADAPTFAPAPSCAQEISPGASLVCDLHFSLPQDIAQPVVYWLPDAAGDTSDVWWYLVG